MNKGTKINKLTLIEETDPEYSKQGMKRAKGIFKCDCGNIKAILLQSVKSGKTKSCGCFQKESRIKHGMYGTKEYSAWISMKQRCNNPNHKHYADYGGRGIKICDRWLESFDNFIADMGLSANNLSLDRIDVNSDYTPENCRWTIMTIQNINKRLLNKNISGKVGVIWCKKCNKWQAQITKDRKQIWLGYFDNLQDAIDAREKAEKELYPENLNSFN